MKKISLHNFRGFDTFEWSFNSGINLIVGDNASGKTSLLCACRLAAGSFFAGFNDENTVWPGPESSDFSEVIVQGVRKPFQPIEIDFELDAEMFPYLPEPQTHKNTYPLNPALCNTYKLQKKSPKNTKQLSSGILPYKRYAKQLQFEEQQNLPFPLFCYFSTEDIHMSRKITSEKFREEYLKRSFGYYMCLDSNGLLPYWERRLLVLKEADEKCEEVETVTNSLLKALGEEGCDILKNIHVRPMRGKIYYELTDGRMVDSVNLSDGYKRLINLVINLAFRSYILNRTPFGKDSGRETHGIVMIDEIDLHLHPALQVKALPALTKTFPGLQFIVTTHSALVMSSVQNSGKDTVKRLMFTNGEGYKCEPIDTFGQDASSIMRNILEVYDRDINVQNELDRLYDFIDNDDMKEAHRLLAQLKERFSDLPDLAKASVTIDFMSDENDNNYQK